MSHLTDTDPDTYVEDYYYEPTLWERLISQFGWLIVLAITVLAVIDCARRPVKRKAMWIVLIILLPLAGPGFYFLLGRYRLEDQGPADGKAGADSKPSAPSAASWNVFRVIGSIVSVIMIAIGLYYIGFFLLIMLVLVQCQLMGGGGSKGCY